MLKIFNQEYPSEIFDQKELDFLQKFENSALNITDIHAEMDLAWDRIMNSDSNISFSDKLNEFYGHPVWLLNAVFTGLDEVSIHHRKSISRYILEGGFVSVLDYGGGGGSLAERIVEINLSTTVNIYEPYASKFLKNKVKAIPNISIVSEVDSVIYDVVIVQDVLEHLVEPFEAVNKIRINLRRGTIVVFANCFYPQIKCHLSRNFYLRHTFVFLLKFLGFDFKGVVKGATHAQIFEYSGRDQKSFFWLANFMAKIIGPFLNKLYSIYRLYLK